MPNIHVFSKYVAKASNLRLVARLVFGGGERRRCQACGIANAAVEAIKLAFLGSSHE